MRDSHVYESFTRMWARRYLDLRKAKGELAARQWFKSFINDADKPRVLAAIEEETTK